MNADELIQHNEKVHNDRFDQYHEFHKDNIFSDLEQNRLATEIKKAQNFFNNKGPYKAIDIGCGTGNLTNHFLNNGFETTAADVSQGFLDLVSNRFKNNALLSTFKLNGKDFSGLPPNSFDIIAVYSVLHHIPNYLAAVKNMAGLCKKEGLIFIDHEVSEEFWNRSDTYNEFLGKVKSFKPVEKVPFKEKIYGRLRNTKLFSSFPRTNKLHPKYQYLGDIHVWPDEHIEWKMITETLSSLGFDVAYSKKYLHYKSYYPEDVYTDYAKKCVDHQIMIFQKR